MHPSCTVAIPSFIHTSIIWLQVNHGLTRMCVHERIIRITIISTFLERRIPLWATYMRLKALNSYHRHLQFALCKCCGIMYVCLYMYLCMYVCEGAYWMLPVCIMCACEREKEGECVCMRVWVCLCVCVCVRALCMSGFLFSVFIDWKRTNSTLDHSHPKNLKQNIV